MHDKIALLGIKDAGVNYHNDRNGMEAVAAAAACPSNINLKQSQ